MRALQRHEFDYVSGGQDGTGTDGQGSGQGGGQAGGSNGAHIVVMNQAALAAATNGNGTPTRTVQGYQDCLALFTEVAIGGAVCATTDGEVFINAGVGTPGASFHAGTVTDVYGYNTGFSMEGQAGPFYYGTSGSASSYGYSFGTPGASVGWGFDLGNVHDLDLNPSHAFTALVDDLNQFAGGIAGYFEALEAHDAAVAARQGNGGNSNNGNDGNTGANGNNGNNNDNDDTYDGGVVGGNEGGTFVPDYPIENDMSNG